MCPSSIVVGLLGRSTLALSVLGLGGTLQAGVVNFTGSDYFSFATGLTGNNPSGSHIRLIFSAASAGSTGVGPVQSLSFYDGSFYSFTQGTVGGFEIDAANRHIRFTSNDPNLMLQTQISGGAVGTLLGTSDFASVVSVDPNSISSSFDQTVSTPNGVYAYKVGSSVYKLQVTSFTVSGMSLSGTFQAAEINLPVFPASPANVLIQTLFSGSSAHAYLSGTTDFNSVTSFDPALIDSTDNRTFVQSPFDVMVFKTGDELYKFQLLSLPANEFSSGAFQFEPITAVPEPGTAGLVGCGTLFVVLGRVCRSLRSVRGTDIGK